MVEVSYIQVFKLYFTDGFYSANFTALYIKLRKETLSESILPAFLSSSGWNYMVI